MYASYVSEKILSDLEEYISTNLEYDRYSLPLRNTEFSKIKREFARELIEKVKSIVVQYEKNPQMFFNHISLAHIDINKKIKQTRIEFNRKHNTNIGKGSLPQILQKNISFLEEARRSYLSFKIYCSEDSNEFREDAAIVCIAEIAKYFTMLSLENINDSGVYSRVCNYLFHSETLAADKEDLAKRFCTEITPDPSKYQVATLEYDEQVLQTIEKFMNQLHESIKQHDLQVQLKAPICKFIPHFSLKLGNVTIEHSGGRLLSALQAAKERVTELRERHPSEKSFVTSNNP